MERKFLQLNDLDSYKTAFRLSNYVWDITVGWDYFAKKTIGEQFVTAIDSISANIAEGFVRYSKKDKIKFYYYSKGSVKEALDWNEKARMRKLIMMEQYKHIYQELQKLPRELNQLIQYTNLKLQQ